MGTLVFIYSIFCKECDGVNETVSRASAAYANYVKVHVDTPDAREAIKRITNTVPCIVELSTEYPRIRITRGREDIEDRLVDYIPSPHSPPPTNSSSDLDDILSIVSGDKDDRRVGESKSTRLEDIIDVGDKPPQDVTIPDIREASVVEADMSVLCDNDSDSEVSKIRQLQSMRRNDNNGDNIVFEFGDINPDPDKLLRATEETADLSGAALEIVEKLRKENKVLLEKGVEGIPFNSTRP